MAQYTLSKYSRKRGLTLIEVIVAMAIVGVIGVVLTQLTDISSVSTEKFTRDNDVNYLVGEITHHLSDPYRCKETFKNPANGNQLFTPPAIVRRVSVDRTGVTPVVTVPGNGRALYLATDPAAVPYGPSRLFVGGYEMTGVGTDEATLRVTVQEKDGINVNLGGRREVIREIPLSTEWDLSNPADPILISCSSLSQANASIWSRGSNLDIYYMGPVGIGIESPTGDFALEVAGDVDIKARVDGSGGAITANAFYYDSDRRLKEKIAPIENAGERVDSLRGVSFEWRHNGTKDYGFIAQELQKEIPEIVHEDQNGQLKLDYVKVLPFLVEAVKEQQREIEELSHEITELQD